MTKNTMLAKDKVVDAVLKHEDWHIEKYFNDGIDILKCKKNGSIPVNFGSPSPFVVEWDYFHNLEDFRYAIYSQLFVVEGHIVRKNPWYHMSDEEILLKCDLENCI